jgi:hypothetical protein
LACRDKSEEQALIEIESLINDTCEMDSENRLTVDDVKRWLADYLEMYEEELTRFPQERGKSHWDMIIADYDSTREGVFVVAYFRNDAVILLSGRGAVPALREFGESTFPSDPDQVLDAAARRFTHTRHISIPAADLTAWLK